MFFSTERPKNRLALKVLYLLSLLLLHHNSSFGQIRWYQDNDNDGFGNPNISQTASLQPTGYVLNNVDCNDNSPNVKIFKTMGSQCFSTTLISNPTLKITNNGTTYLAYENANNSKANVVKYVGSSSVFGWDNVGNANFTSQSALQLKLAVDKNNTPYVAFLDGANQNKVTVMKFNGTSWITVGSAGFSGVPAASLCLAIDSAGAPYVAYATASTVYSITVMKYSNATWSAVGTAGFTSSLVNCFPGSLIIDTASNTPYLSYTDGGYNDAATVVKFNGTTWVNVGSSGFSNGQAQGQQLALDTAGIPYIVYTEAGNGYKIVLRKFNGSSWTYFGNPVSSGSAGAPNITFDRYNTPYISYTAGNPAMPYTVRYDGVNWVSIGSIDFLLTSVGVTSLALDSVGIPQVAFVDNLSGGRATVMRLTPRRNDPSKPYLSTTANVILPGGSTTLSVGNSSLYDATVWKWYKAGCGNTLVDTGATITVTPNTPLTIYYARAEGTCVAPGPCDSIKIHQYRRTWYQDNDGDGWGNPNVSQVSATQPAGYVLNNYDCNDASVNAIVWDTVGSGPAAPGSSGSNCLAISKSGIPYVAFSDANNSNKATVMKFNGSTWVTVGNAGFTPGGANFISLALDTNEIPYIAFSDAASYSGNATVMKYSGNNWSMVGSGSISGLAYYINLVIDKNNTPYIAFSEVTNGDKITVKKFNGSNWVDVGYPRFSQGQAWYISMAIDRYGNPFVSYQDKFFNSDTARLMKFDGANWREYGNPYPRYYLVGGFYSSVDVDYTGTPHYVFVNAYSAKDIVLKSDGINQTVLGPTNIGGAGIINGNVLKVDPAGRPYVLYNTLNPRMSTLVSYSNSSWDTVAGLPSGAITSTLALDSNGIPYVISYYNANSAAITVLKMSPYKIKPDISISANTTTSICAGTAVTFTATIANGGTNPSYQWRKNHVIVGTNNNTYIDNALANNDTIECVLISTASCTTSPTDTSNRIIMTVHPLTSSVNIVATPGDTICAGANVAFTATPTNGGTNPVYQWKINGINTGSNSNTFSSSSLNNNDIVTCIMTSNAACLMQNMDTSNAIGMTVNPILIPDVYITASTGNTVCAGTPVTYTATPTNGGSNPTYQWKLNNANTGSNSSSLTISTPTNGDVISCVMTTNAVCPSKSNDTSNAIAMTVNPMLTPSVSITSSTTGAICAGTTVTFTATPVNGGSTPSYQWTINGINAGSNSNTFTTPSLANNDVVRCTMTSNATCRTADTTRSNSVTMTVNPIMTPVVSVTAIPGDSICAGTSVTFVATPTNGGTAPMYIWQKNGSNAATGNSYTSTTLADNDVITCIMTTNAICPSSATDTSDAIAMTVKPILTPSISISVAPDDTICNGTNTVFTALSVNGGTAPSYQWAVNGILTGTNSNVLSTVSLLNNDIVTCILSSNAICPLSPTALSNGIRITVNPLLIPGINITIAPNDSICAGTHVSFTSATVNAGQTPIYTWKKNGIVVNGANTGIYANALLADKDTITCELQSSEACATQPVTSSNSIVMNVSPVTTPVANPYGVKTGDIVIFYANAQNAGTQPSFQWFKNGSAINGATDSVLSIDQWSENDVFWVKVTSSDECAQPKDTTSATINISRVTSVRSIQSFGEVNLYPNPNHGSFTIEGSVNDLTCKLLGIKIVNAIGQTVYTDRTQVNFNRFEKNIDLSNKLANGVYYIYIISEKSSLQLKFVNAAE